MTLAAHASPNGGPVGVFEAHADIGSPKLAGNATYNAATQEYRLTAAGYNVWFERDEMHFAWRTMRG
ncbi:MAG: biopolymer transporter TolR, partial [Xanthomonadaceae bacterium]|nr:biopolymer transporter TolR [Xanthomonadaceae bacterium]